MIPPIIPLTSDTPGLRQHVSHSPVAGHDPNPLSTQAAHIRMTLQHHERNFATLSAHMHTRSVSYETSCKSHVCSLQNETRLPPKVTLRVCKTSISYETSSKSHTSSLQNERFVRDFLRNSHVKVCKTSLSYETFSNMSSGNTHRSSHITQPCQAVSRFQPLRTTPAHAPIPMSQSYSPLPQLTTSRFPAPAKNLAASTRLTRASILRLPRSVTSVTARNFTISCACHENLTSTPQSPHKVLRLPRKVTISYHVSFRKICTTPHVWNGFDPF